MRHRRGARGKSVLNTCKMSHNQRKSYCSPLHFNIIYTAGVLIDAGACCKGRRGTRDGGLWVSPDTAVRLHRMEAALGQSVDQMKAS